MRHHSNICRPHRNCKQAGFTLIELLITVAVAAILLAIAIPSFRSVIESTNMSGMSNDLLGDLKYARTEAASRGVNVAVAASAGDWTNGWTVTAGGVVLRVHDVTETNYTITEGTSGSQSGDTVVFQADGSLEDPSLGVCFTIEAPTGTTNEPVRMLVRPVGTVSQFEGAADAGSICTP